MSCNFDDMLLYEYLDDILDTDTKLQVERHLSACPACRKKISEMKLLYYELDNLEELSVPEEVDLIRQEIVADAFENPSLTTMEKLQKTKEMLEDTPVIGSIIPTKENLGKAAKGLYNGSKKIYQSIPKKEKTKKKKNTFGRIL